MKSFVVRIVEATNRDELLKKLVTRNGVKKVHVLCHSLKDGVLVVNYNFVGDDNEVQESTLTVTDDTLDKQTISKLYKIFGQEYKDYRYAEFEASFAG